MATREEFGAWAAALGPGLVATLTAVTGRRAVAEDVAQESFLRAWASGVAFESKEHLKAWARTTGVRLAVDYLRRASREDIEHELPAYPPTAVVDTAERALARADVLEALHGVACLPPGQRSVTVLRILGFGPTDIAQHLGLPPATVKTWLAEGRQAMNARRGRSWSLALALGLCHPLRALRRLRVGRAAAPPMLAVGAAVAVLAPLVIHLPAGRTPVSEGLTGTGTRGVSTRESGRDAAAVKKGLTVSRVPAVHKPSPAPSPLTRPNASAAACVRGMCVRARVQESKPPVGKQDAVYVRIPAVAGEEERYVVVDDPTGMACPHVPTTTATGCVSSTPSPSPTSRKS